MNLSIIAKRIKIDLGIYGISLPIENLDDMIVDIITDITRPVFSIYCPMNQTTYLDLRRLKKIEKTASYESFLLPDFQGRKILDIKDIRYDDRSLTGVGYWGGTIPMLHEGLTTQLMLSNAAMNLVNLGLPRLTWDFQGPRTVYIYNCLASHSLIFEFMMEHDPSLMSIPATAEESFFKLALLDVKKSLYSIVKHYNNIETVYGNIDLKIDDWADADNQRNDLLNQWDDNYHLDRAQTTYG